MSEFLVTIYNDASEDRTILGASYYAWMATESPEARGKLKSLGYEVQTATIPGESGPEQYDHENPIHLPHGVTDAWTAQVTPALKPEDAADYGTFIQDKLPAVFKLPEAPVIMSQVPAADSASLENVA